LNITLRQHLARITATRIYRWGGPHKPDI